MRGQQYIKTGHNVGVGGSHCFLTTWRWMPDTRPWYPLFASFSIHYLSMTLFRENLSGFFPWDLPVVEISPECLRSQGRVSPVIGLLPLASGPPCLGMEFPPFLLKPLYRCDSVVISSFVRTGYTTRSWGWPLRRIGYSITHHYPLFIC